MTLPYVELVAERPGHRLVMRAPTERAEDALLKFAEQLSKDYTFTARPVDDLALKSESA